MPLDSTVRYVALDNPAEFNNERFMLQEPTIESGDSSQFN